MQESTRRVLYFTGLTYFISWLFIGVYFAFGGEWGTKSSMGTALIYMWIPGITALFLNQFVHKESLKKGLSLYFKPNIWFLVAWLIPPLIALATNEAGLQMPGHEYSPGMEGFYDKLSKTLTPEQIAQMKTALDNMPVSFFWLNLIQGLIAGITINAIFALGEELGWRGYLFNTIGTDNFWRTSFIIGIIWGIWHWPIILKGHNYPEHPVAGVFMMIAFTVLITPLMNFVRIRSGSVVAPAIFHGTINGLAAIPVMMIVGGSDLTVGLTGLAGLIVLTIADIILWIYMNFVDKAEEGDAIPVEMAV